MIWRFIETEPLDAYSNMAIDEAIMESVRCGQAPPTLRFYRWKPPGITIGYFQRISKAINLEACKRYGVNVVRRLTGGRAVLHQNELTYSLIASENHPVVAGSILQSYLAISAGLVKGLEKLSVPAQLVEGVKNHRHSTAACFDAPSWYELVVGNKKMVGSAQTRRGGVLLQHGSIPVQANIKLLFNCLNFSSEKMRQGAIKRFDNQATCLTEVMGYQPSHNEVVSAIKAGFSEGLQIDLRDGELTLHESEQAAVLARSKYQAQEWNYRR